MDVLVIFEWVEGEQETLIFYYLSWLKSTDILSRLIYFFFYISEYRIMAETTNG